jgi:hypothetical protein
MTFGDLLTMFLKGEIRPETEIRTKSMHSVRGFVPGTHGFCRTLNSGEHVLYLVNIDDPIYGKFEVKE